MEPLLVLMIIVFGLAIFGALAVAVGADSRETVTDDWSRRCAA